MPLYEYECDACSERFEVIQKFSDPQVDVCRKCGKGPVRRLLSSPAIQFKGTGWYITDYAKKSGGGDTSKGKATKANDASASDTTSSSDSAAKSDAPAASSAPAGSTTTTSKE